MSRTPPPGGDGARGGGRDRAHQKAFIIFIAFYCFASPSRPCGGTSAWARTGSSRSHTYITVRDVSNASHARVHA